MSDFEFSLSSPLALDAAFGAMSFDGSEWYGMNGDVRHAYFTHLYAFLFLAYGAVAVFRIFPAREISKLSDDGCAWHVVAPGYHLIMKPHVD